MHKIINNFYKDLEKKFDAELELDNQDLPIFPESSGVIYYRIFLDDPWYKAFWTWVRYKLEKRTRKVLLTNVWEISRDDFLFGDPSPPRGEH